MMPSSDVAPEEAPPPDALEITPGPLPLPSPTGDDLVARTRALLADSENRFPESAQVTRALGLSSRTLRRKLARQGTSFLALRDAARRTRAIALLEGSTLTVERIATELGYSESAGFVRAFHRWMGESPGSYRRRVAR